MGYENSPFGIIINKLIRDDQGRPVDFIHQQANHSASVHLGMKLSDLVGSKATQIADKETALKFIHKYEAVVRTGTPCNFEYYFSHHDRTLWVTAFHLIDDLFITTFTDVSEQIRAQEDRRKSEAKYEKMMKAIKDPVYICSQQFKIEYMNPSMIDRVGYDATGELCHLVIHDLNEQCAWCKNDIFFEEGHAEKNIVSPKDNRTFNVLSSSFKNDDGTYSKISVFRDITDYNEMQNRLQQAQKMESIGTLAGGIAHDFNNILSSILGFSGLALGEVEKGSVIEDDLTQIHTAGLRAKELVKQILTFARQSDDKIKPVMINPIAKEALKLIRSSIPSTIEIIENINSTKRVMANPSQIHQIFMNICTNAAQAMDEQGGVLGVDLSDCGIENTRYINGDVIPPGNYIEITISDTGAGVPVDNLKTIFEPYYTTKKKGEGTGLGLAVVHGIIEKCKGKILVESRMGQGSKFTVYLPSIEDKSIDEPFESDLNLPKGKEKILFVDDEPQIIKMGYRCLSKLGYEVVTCFDGLEAIDVFKENPAQYDMVISDMTMPKMTGDKLAQQIMKIKPDIKFILCTGYSKKLNKTMLQSLGIHALMIKPVDTQKMAHTVRNILDA